MASLQLLCLLLSCLQLQAASVGRLSYSCPDGLDIPEGVTSEEVARGVAATALVVVDVREPEELVETGIIPSAVNVPLSEVNRAFALSPEAFLTSYGVPKPAPEETAFSCKTGVRATEAWELTRKFGYCDARVYFGSMTEWLALGLPTQDYVIPPSLP